MIHNISRFIAALALLATAQGAWAVGLTTNITYVGLEASDVTVQVTYNNGATTKTVTSGRTIWNIGGQNVSVSVTSTKGIGTTFSATYKHFGSQDKALDVNQDGNTCTFTTDAKYDNTLNITVTINNRYTVHYDANKGSGTMADQEFLVDNAQSLSPCTFTYSVMGTQYAFCGWNTAADGSGTGYADGESVTNLTSGDQIITLYAQWAPYFMIHFDKNAEDATGTMANQKRDNTGSVKLRTNAYSREGYTFKCWNTKADGTGTSYTDCQSVGTLASRGQIVTLYAQWVAQYTVHFNANGGSGTMSDQTIGVGQAQALTANTFTRDGYYFAGWNTQADGTGTTYNDGQSVTDLAAANETINLYAQWKEPVTADYVDANGDAHTLTDCKEITSGHMPTSLAGNYIVSESVTYTGKVTLSGNTTIILANGKTMSIGTEAAPLGGDYALYASGTNSLTIYGQSLDAATAGSLEVYSTWGAAVRLYEGSYAQHSGNVVVNFSGGSNNKSALKAGGSVTIDGGKLDASITSEGSFAIDASGNISISGGSVIANATGADSYGMRSGGNITLTWTRATDRITASGYQSTNGTVSLSKRFAFDDGGTVTQATTDNIGGKTLRPAALVTFNANGGSDVAAQTLFVGTAATEPTPTRTGYDLSGWTLGNADYDFATLVTEDITLTAQWTPDPAHFSVSGDEYTIHTATGWNVFCDALQDNDTYNRFSGKTVQLDADITVSRMAGSSKHDFCGTFDGGGHTLTFNHGTSDSYASDEYTAPFCYVSTVTPSGGSEVPTNFRNLHVSGDIYTTAKYAAGLIARQWGTVYVENCRSSIVVHSNVTNDQNGGNDGTHGGFVSVQQDGTLSFTGCTFDGKLLTDANNATTRCGGFVGYLSSGTTTITNCLYAPAALADGETEVVDGNSATFVRNGAPTVTNSYYTRALGTAQGKATRTVAAADDVTIEAVALTGTATQYTVSGITAYSGGGLQRGQTLYYGSGDKLSLTLSNTATPAPRGYQYGYTASAGTLSGTTLTMPDQDVTISVNTAALAPIDWATVNQGNSADPYMIYNKDQLLLLAHRVNGTSGETANEYMRKYFKLGADITFTYDANEGDDYAENYEAIGGYIGGTTRDFCGNFDGDGHTVSGIRIRKTGSDDADQTQGLFGQIAPGANIHDVHLTDARIKGHAAVGGIVGYNGEGYIMRCSVTDSYITAVGEYGTICGINDGTLTNNYYHGCTVNGTAVTSGKGCHGADLADNHGALPAYAITLGANITTPPGTFAGQTEWLDTPPVNPRLAPENGFTQAGNHYFASGYEFTPGSTLASGAAQGYTPRATLGGQLLDLYTPTGDNDLLAGKAIARLTITADCDGKTLASTQAIYSTGQPVTVAYIKADGTPGEASAIALDGHETLDEDGRVSLAAGTYYVGTDIAYATQIMPDGNITLILANGKTMTLYGNTMGIDGYNLTIYGQSLDDAIAGTLRYDGKSLGIYVSNYEQHSGNVSITTTGSLVNGIYANVTLLGGTLTVSADGTYARAIYGNTHSILGGHLTATATGTDAFGIYASANSGTALTLGWTRPADRITASSISAGGGTVAVADGKKLHNGSDYLGGTLSDPAAALNGKTLRPAATATYTTADGTTDTADAILLDASDNSLPAGNYIATGTLNYTHTLTLTGNVTLILADNCHMNVGTSGEGRFNGYGIDGYDSNTDTMYDLTITSEANGSGNGALSVYTTGNYNTGITANTLTINGGNITADTNGDRAPALSVDKDVTINGGTVNARTAGTGYTTFAIYASEDFNYNGGNVTATAPNTYAICADGNYTFSWRTPADRITIGATGLYAPDDGGTVAVADGKKLHNGTDFLGGTLGDPAADINGKTLRPAATATYITADGTADTADAILLDASDNSLPAGNYLATGTLNYTHTLTLTGNVTLILADNCHMNIGTSGEGRFNGYGIDGYDSNTYTMYDLTITSEANGSGNGALSVYTKGTGNDAIFASELTINGGNITADTEGNGAHALIAGHDIVTINGGTVSANATGSDADAIYSKWKYGTITLGWSKPTDRITASSYSGTVTLARLFTDAADPADNYYGGTYAGDALNALAGKTLSGTTEVTLTEDNATQALAAINDMSGIGVTFNREFTASKPSTICLPFDYTKKEGDGSFYAFTSIEHSGGEYIATMTEPGTTTLTANTPYLYLPSATGNVEFSGTPTTAIAAGTTTSGDWTFQGTYDEVKWDTAPTGIYGFSAQNVSDQSISQGEFVKVGAKVRIRPLRAYLKYKNGTENYSAAPTRGTTAELPDRIIVHLIGSDGNTTAIGTLDTRTGEVEIDTWYDLNGRKLSAKPTHRGIYINNGRKVVIK